MLSEVRDPIRTIKLAAPLAMMGVTAVYLLINISYFAVVSKTDILESQRIVVLVITEMIYLMKYFCSIIFFQSVIFPKSIWSRDRKGTVSIAWLHHSLFEVSDTLIRHIRLLAPSSRYLRWAAFYLTCFLMAEVTS